MAADLRAADDCRSIESISEMVSHLHTAQREQTKGGDQILQAIEALRELARNQESRLGEFHRSIEVISRTAEALSNLAQTRHRMATQLDGDSDDL